MSDNLGPNQTRVLDYEDRSFEKVVYQRKKPPLSSEVNLTGDVASNHSQNLAQFLLPSGWGIVGDLKDGTFENESDAGDVICSSTYNANYFRLIAQDKNVEKKNLIAYVNGWGLLIQGSNSLDENNTLILSTPPSTGYRIDFVFLEVWRKLLSVSDVVYRYGNVLYGGTNPSNDLIDPAINIETSRRVQIQYRIRIVSDIDIESYPNGFDLNKVFVQGPLTSPLSTCSHAYFAQVPSDPGLWRAGVGDTAAQEDLGTVDGYTYAIPMFAIHRRNTGSYNVELRSNGAGKSVADYLLGQPSDRPDNQYNDWVVSDDFLDMRHRITPIQNMLELCASSFEKLTHGKIRQKMAKTTLGEDHFGTILTQADAVSYTDLAGSTLIAAGDGLRRMFSNAQIDQPDTLIVKTVNDKTTGTPGAAWATSDQVQISLPIYPTGSIVNSVDEIYTSSGALILTTDYTVSGTGTNIVTITVPGTSSLLSTSVPITIDYTVQFAAGQNGTTYLLERFLEVRNELVASQIIAPIDADIRVRTSDPVIATDGTHFNMLSNQGANSTEPYNFGHQMIYHALGNGTQFIMIDRTTFEYDILGISSVYVNSGYRTPIIIRNATQYLIDMQSPAVSLNTDIEVKLYLGSKLFNTNKQSRAIIDTYEMSELTTLEAPNSILTQFTVDSTNKAIQAVASGAVLDGAGFAYVDGTQVTLTSTNSRYPADSTKSRIEIDFGAYVPASGTSIEVPVLMKSAITSIEGYDFFYQTVPYQGLLDSTTKGVIEAVGPALVTTAGSGGITDTTVSSGLAGFTTDSTSIAGQDTNWLAEVKVGYLINADSIPSKQFEIAQVYSNTSLTITGKPNFTSLILEAYTITGKDVPSFFQANIIDRLPNYDATNDSHGRSENISTVVSDGFPVLESRILSKVQNIIDSPPNAVIYGNGAADRGRSIINIPNAPLGLGNLGLKFEKLDTIGYYQKTYQSYILNRENDGRLYLMVIGSESDKSSLSRFFDESSDLDTMDIFEIPGRPIIMRGTE